MARRRFNGRERVAMWLLADGKCSNCGVELEAGWHGDHVMPFGAGGPTDITNGQSLCPPCNFKKGGSVHTDPRSRWQEDAIERFFESPDTNFLVTACPGSGKTRMALGAASQFIDAGRVNRLIVVCPTKALCGQWSSEAHAFGLDISSNYSNSDGALTAAAHGVVVTYQTVASQPDMWRRHCSDRQTLVVFDEIHHCADNENSAWGPALRKAFEPARHRLLLSGTPFRTDGTAIPFVRYDGNGLSVSHHGLTYGQAVADSIVRPIRYEAMDGDGEWLRGSLVGKATASAVAEEDRAALITTLFEPDGAWVRTLLVAANKELSRVREEMPDAGGLIVASSIEHAKRYASIMEEVCGEGVSFVHSQMFDSGGRTLDPGPIIRRFKNNRDRWIVAVDLISEGIDIPRLAVGVYASRKMTEMWFRQVSGRVIRNRDDDDAITATFFIPHLKELVELAGRIESEADAGLRDMEKREREKFEDGQTLLPFEIVPVESSPAHRGSVITSGESVPDSELERAMQVIAGGGSSVKSVHPADLALGLRLLKLDERQDAVRVHLPKTHIGATGDEHRKALKKQINLMVNRLVRNNDELKYEEIHGELNAMCGNRLPQADIPDLEKRIRLLESWA